MVLRAFNSVNLRLGSSQGVAQAGGDCRYLPIRYVPKKVETAIAEVMVLALKLFCSARDRNYERVHLDYRPNKLHKWAVGCGCLEQNLSSLEPSAVVEDITKSARTPLRFFDVSDGFDRTVNYFRRKCGDAVIFLRCSHPVLMTLLPGLMSCDIHRSNDGDNRSYGLNPGRHIANVHFEGKGCGEEQEEPGGEDECGYSSPAIFSNDVHSEILA